MPKTFQLRLIMIGLSIFLAAACSTAHAQTPPTTTVVNPGIAEIDLYVKIFGALVAALATLFGLPIVFLTYKKTRTEITKLELESATLREKLPEGASRTHSDQGGIQVNVENSPNVRIEILADPKFLAPLLLLVDFIFAWLVLTLAGYFLSLFSFFGVIRTLALAVLAAILLLPIAKQVVRVRTVLRPPRSAEEVQASIRQAKLATYISYTMMIVVAFVFASLLLLVDPANLTDLGRYLAWGLLALGGALVLLIPVIKPRVDKYLVSLIASP